jgi:hypothetical protein
MYFANDIGVFILVLIQFFDCVEMEKMTSNVKKKKKKSSSTTNVEKFSLVYRAFPNLTAAFFLEKILNQSNSFQT